MKKEKILNIYECKGLYGKALVRLDEIRSNVKGTKEEGFLPLSYIYLKIGRSFSLKKSEIRELLFFLRDFGFIEVCHMGIKFNFEIKNE